MKKLLIIAFFLIFTCSAWALDIDFSASQTNAVNSQIIRIHNLTSLGLPGKYWVDFQWDPVNLIMVPVAAGAEVVPSAVGTWAVTFDWTCDGTNDATSYWTFNDNGSLSSSTGMTASWQMANNTVSIYFDSNSSYTGTLGADNNTMSGTIANTGCWSAARSSSVTEKTWNFWVYNSSTSYTVTLKSNANHTFDITFSPGTGNPWVCMTVNYEFIQGNSTFDFSSARSDVNTALVSFPGGWDGCDYIYQGQTISGTISGIPTWFDFNSEFGVAIGSDFLYLEPDGSTHR